MTDALIAIGITVYLVGAVATFLNFGDEYDTETVAFGVALMWPVVLTILAIKGSILAIYYALIGKL